MHIMTDNIVNMRIIFKLTRFYLSLAIAFSSLAGFILFNHTLNWTALWTFIGVLFLACSASVINQIQEMDLDALMKRTQDRPLPSKQLKPQSALFMSIGIGLKGFLLLYFVASPISAFLGVFNIFWYNMVYTPLKRKTRYAVLIGAVTGSIPPTMGWAAAGGNIFSPDILLVAFFMFLWQIPHFWLLLLKFGKEYEIAGFPSVFSFKNERQIRNIIFFWIIGTSASTISFPFFHVISSPVLIVSLVLINIILISFFYRSIFFNRIFFDSKYAFRSLYLYQILVLVVLMIQALK